ncbi:hypothetical protein ACFV2X_29915 [Streptomyces sp. NPDC059679]|uniref:effector-associated constant component EACC1 n=1 Tax=Streptomyces sp. NPDC059679 TaxID=3346903 RepID=UPI0036A0DF3B
MAELRVSADGAVGADNEDELRSLLRWLREDESLERLVGGRVGAAGPAVPGHMGTGFDVLQLVLGTGLSSAALAVSILQWRDARRTRPALTLRRGDIEVDIPPEAAADEDTVRRIVALLEAPGTGEGTGSDDSAA